MPPFSFYFLSPPCYALGQAIWPIFKRLVQSRTVMAPSRPATGDSGQRLPDMAVTDCLGAFTFSFVKRFCACPSAYLIESLCKKPGFYQW
jgi:hypothetical protein